MNHPPPLHPSTLLSTAPPFLTKAMTSMTSTPESCRKRVRFEEDEERNVKRRIVHYLPKSSDMTEEERGITWYRLDEYKDFLDSAREAAISSRSDRKANRQSSAASYAQVFYVSYTTCCAAQDGDSIPEQLTTELALRSVVGDPPRGLERMVNSRVGMDRSMRRVSCIRSLVHLQKELEGASQDETSQCLAIFSEQMSRPSRLFARELGYADAAAALAVYHQAAEQPAPDLSQTADPARISQSCNDDHEQHTATSIASSPVAA